MTDTQFDDYFNDKLRDHQASVPPGLWDKVKDNQLDQVFSDKLKDASAPVPEGLWDKITDSRFDEFIGGKLFEHTAPVPGGLWDKITDGQFDEFIGGKLLEHTAPVPAGLWDKVTDGQFDNFFAGKLYNHSVAVPEGLWDKVNPNKEDERRPAFILFRYPAAALLILALLIGGSLGGYLFVQNGKGINHEIALPQISTNANGTDGKEKTDASSLTHEPANAAATNKANAVPPSTGNSDNNILKNEKHLNSESANQNNSNGNDDAAISNATVSSSRVKKQAFKLSPENKQLIRNGLDFNQRTNQENATKNNNNQQSVDKTTAADNGFDFIEPYHSNVLTGVPVPTAAGRDYSMFDLTDKKLSTANHTNQFRNVIICPADKKNHNTDWFLEAYTSPDIALKTVSNNRATQQYLLTKDSSESMQISYSAGLRLVKPLNDNILLKAGVQYSQINQKYVYRTENEVKTTTVVTVRTIIRAPGDTVIVHDTSTVQQIGFKNNTVYNRFRSFDIPVTVGYQFGDEDLKFGINAGVVFNVSSWYQGVILDSSLATVTLNKTGNGVYKTNIGMGLYAGVSVIKKLGEDMHIFFEPYFRYNLSNMTTTGAAYNQKFSLGGLAVGLRLNLNRK
jgi:hypothetical protein